MVHIKGIVTRWVGDQDGAVTVDWVVLTAALVGLGIAVLTAVGGATEDLGNRISQEIVNQP